MRVLVGSKFRNLFILIIAGAFFVAGCNTQRKEILKEGFSDAFNSVDVSVNDRFLSGGPESTGQVTQQTVIETSAIEKFAELSKKNPKGILIDGNNMYVSDWVARSLSVVNMQTKKETVLVPAIDFVSDMVRGRNGAIIAGLFTGEQVVSIDRVGKVTRLAGNLGKVSAVAVSPSSGEIYAASFDRGIIYKLNNDLTKEPEKVIDNLQNPAGIVFGSDGRMYVAQFSSTSESVVRYDMRVLTKEVFAIGITQPSKMVFAQNKFYVGGAEAGRSVIWRYDVTGNGEVLIAAPFDDPIVGPATSGKYLYFGSSSGAEKNIYRVAI